MAFWSDPSSLFPKQSHRWVVYLEPFSDEDRRNVPHYLVKSVDRPSYKIDTLQAKYLYSHTFNFPKRLVWNPIKIEFYDVFWTLTKKKKDEYRSVGGTPYADTESLYKPGTSSITVNEPTGPDFPGVDIKVALPKIKIVDPEGRIPIKFPDSNETTTFTTQKFFYNFLQNSGHFNPNEEDIDDIKLYRFRSYHFKKNMITALTGQTTNENLLINNSPDYKTDYIYLAELDGDGIVIEEWKIYNPLITDISNNKLDYASDSVLTMTVGITYDWAELVQFDRSPKKQNNKKVELSPQDEE